MTTLVFGLIAAIVIAQFTGLIIAFARGASRTRVTTPARAVAVVVIALALITCSVTFVPASFLLPRSSGDATQTPPQHPAPEATTEVHATTPAGHATLPVHGTPSQHGAGAPTSTPLPAAAFTPAAVVAVRVNGAQRYQTFEGFGASLTIFEETGVYNRHDPSQPVVTTATREQREAIADVLYRQLGLSRLRVFLEDFEPANDNADPMALQSLRLRLERGGCGSGLRGPGAALRSAHPLADVCHGSRRETGLAARLAAGLHAQRSVTRARAFLAEARDLFKSFGNEAEERRIRARLRDLPPQPGGKPSQPAPAGLSRRELDVLRLLAQGKTNREIAEALALSEKTVANHVTMIFNKIGADNRVAAAAFAMRQGLV